MILKKIQILFFLFLIFILNNNLLAKINNKIIAKVGDEIITSFDIENKIKTNLFLSSKEINQENINNVKSSTLNLLINLKVKSNEIKKHKIPINEQAINQYIKSISNNLNLGKTDLINQFQIYGISYEQFYEDIKTEFLWQRLVAKTYLDKIKINDEQINTELNVILKKKEEENLIEEFNLSEIEITFNNEIEEKESKKKILNYINEAGFSETAIKFSSSATALNGGNLGWVRTDQISAKVLNAIKSLKIGEVSKPIKNENTLTFLKLNEKKTSNKFDEIDAGEIKIALENKMKNELLSLYSNSHLSKIKNITIIQFQ